MNIGIIEDGNTNINNVVLKVSFKNTTETPHCIKHGAMNKVAVFEGGAYWRCCTSTKEICRSGCKEFK
jgi:hypothetical protein